MPTNLQQYTIQVEDQEGNEGTKNTMAKGEVHEKSARVKTDDYVKTVLLHMKIKNF